MEVQADKLLMGHTVIRSNDLESFHAYIKSMEGCIKRHVANSSRVSIELRHAYLGRVDVAVSYCSVSMTVEANRELAADFLIQFPLDGSFDLVIDQREVSVAPGTAAVISPAQRVRRISQPGWTLVFRVPSDYLRGRLEMRLGRTLTGPLEFHPLVSSGAHELLGYCLLVVEAIDRGAAPRDSSVAKVLEDGFINLLLDLQPHSMGETLVRSEEQTRADRIRLVTEYLADHFQESLTVEQLATIAGCSVRSLQAMFSDLCGMSPMEYLRRYRLTRAHRLLESAVGGSTVSKIASQTGFTHLARFATSYRARYGEAPSETLRRATRLRKPK